MWSLVPARPRRTGPDGPLAGGTAAAGGSGHIGTYLSPRLVEAGHDVICVSRGLRKPYREHDGWKRVAHVQLDRAAEESKGSFGERIAGLDAEVVIDLTCYTIDSARQLVGSLRGRVGHLLPAILGEIVDCSVVERPATALRASPTAVTTPDY